MRSFAKIKPLRKFPNLQYIAKSGAIGAKIWCAAGSIFLKNIEVRKNHGSYARICSLFSVNNDNANANANAKLSSYVFKHFHGLRNDGSPAELEPITKFNPSF